MRQGREIKKATAAVLAALLAACQSLQALTLPQNTNESVKNPMPKWAVKVFNRKLAKKYELVSRILPCDVQGDFDRDKKLDAAFQIKDRLKGKRGILIINRTGKLVLIGAGNKFPKADGYDEWLALGPDDEGWQLFNKGIVPHNCASESTPPFLFGDALQVNGPDTSLIIYFDGKKFDLYAFQCVKG